MTTAEAYAHRAERFEREADRQASRSRSVSNLRGLAFVVALTAGLYGVFSKERAPAAGPLAAVAALSFVALIVAHGRILGREQDARRWARVNRDAQARVTGKWRTLPLDGARFLDERHPYTADLDVFGPGSLFQRISVARTHYGQRALAAYLSEPSDLAVASARQHAARTLAPELDLRQRLEASAVAVTESADTQGIARRRAPSGEPLDPEPFLQWAEAEPRLSIRRALVITAWALPPILFSLIAVAQLKGWSPAVWAPVLVVQIFVAFSVRAETGRVFFAVSATQGAFVRYGPMLEVIERAELASPLIQSLRERLSEGGAPPSAAMLRFQRLLGWFELRHNGLVHPFVDAFLLWDLHCVLALEKWQRVHGRRARRWFEALGEFEALSSLAGLAHDEPEFSWPDLVDGPAVFIASELAHPLIDRDRRVANDVALAEPGRGLLVTGSNMSGKSTLLRSMGLAAVLALAGGPVCAVALRLAFCRVRTSIRVRDSLEQGVSHFYAEVRKLKTALESAEAGEAVLFLLDEILHGTNSRERQVGARWLLRRLLECGAIGAVTTHDLELCRLEGPLMERVVQCHFQENVEDGRMTFDYKLRQGPVSGGNALRIMRMLGMGVPADPGGADL